MEVEDPIRLKKLFELQHPVQINGDRTHAVYALHDLMQMHHSGNLRNPLTRAIVDVRAPGALVAGKAAGAAGDAAAEGTVVELGAADTVAEEGTEGGADVASPTEPDAGGEVSSSLSRSRKPAATRISTIAPKTHDFAFQLLSIVGLSMRPLIPTRCGVKPARRAAGVPS